MAASASALGVVDTPPALATRTAVALFGGRGPRPVLDPACGSGALLLAALAEAGGSVEFACRGLFGIERCPRRLAQARSRILAAARPGTSAERARLERALERHLVAGDGLDPALPWPRRVSILANPPWLSLSGRQAATLEPEQRSLYRRHWRAARHGWPSVHGAFLERAAEHVAADRGQDAAVLVPRAVIDLEGYAPLREALAARVALTPPAVDLGEDAFPGVAMPAALVFLAPATTENFEERREAAPPVDALAGFPRLPAGTFADPGVHTGNSARLLVRDAGADLGFAAAPLRVGRDLTPFRLGAPSKLLRTDLAPETGVRFRVPARERLEGFPILLRQTADRPMAARHRDPTYFRNSLLACRAVPDLDPDFLVGVLNSRTLAAWHRAHHADARQSSFPQVKVRHLSALPVPIRRRADDPRLHDEVARLARAIEAGSDDSDRERVERLVRNAFGLTEPVAVP